ncbi:hypothetical protein TNCV_2166271 [Trichonephila clavipes]|nr:hypothetical protein TNCV_2166271 [Trichonephila clavipes]
MPWISCIVKISQDSQLRTVVSRKVTTSQVRTHLGGRLTKPHARWKRKLDEAGASEINSLYPESRRKDEKKDQYLKSLPRKGGWRKRTAERGRNWSTSRGREWKSAGRGLNSPKTRSRSTKNAVEREMLLFCSRNEKEKSLQGETYRRHSRCNEAGALTLIPVLMRGKCI